MIKVTFISFIEKYFTFRHILSTIANVYSLKKMLSSNNFTASYFKILSLFSKSIQHTQFTLLLGDLSLENLKLLSFKLNINGFCRYVSNVECLAILWRIVCRRLNRFISLRLIFPKALMLVRGGCVVAFLKFLIHWHCERT